MHTQPCVSLLLAMSRPVAERQPHRIWFGEKMGNVFVFSLSIKKSIKEQRERYDQREMTEKLSKISYTYMCLYLHMQRDCTFVYSYASMYRKCLSPKVGFNSKVSVFLLICEGSRLSGMIFKESKGSILIYSLLPLSVPHSHTYTHTYASLLLRCFKGCPGHQPSSKSQGKLVFSRKFYKRPLDFLTVVSGFITF